jgi:hypothetical protein
VTAGEPIVFHLRVATGDSTVWGLSNGFRVYSEAGHIWDTLTAAWTDAVTDSMFTYRLVTPLCIGESADTIGVAGLFATSDAVYLYSGFDSVAWLLTVGPIGPQHSGSTICLDSSFFRPCGRWKWVSPWDRWDFMPTWDGPHCYTVVAASCCVIRGDINHDGVGPEIGDLVYLSNYMFSNGPEPPCLDEADVNGDSSPADISDLLYLSNYMFSGGPSPVACE